MIIRLVPSKAGSSVRTADGVLHLPGLSLEITPARTPAGVSARVRQAVAGG
jgi:hypothetical protein